jgi:hypothetical protein
VKKYIYVTLISLLAWKAFWVSAAAQGLLSVQELNAQKKTYDLFVFEIPKLVESWTRSCIERENRRIADGVTCWRDAAAAVEHYSSGLSGPLVERVNQLKEAWLQRIGQLQSPQPREETEVAGTGQLAVVSMPIAEAEPEIGRLVIKRRPNIIKAQPENSANRRLPKVVPPDRAKERAKPTEASRTSVKESETSKIAISAKEPSSVKIRKPKPVANASAEQHRRPKAKAKVVALKMDPDNSTDKGKPKDATKIAVDVRDQCKALFGPLSQIRRHRGDWYCTQP